MEAAITKDNDDFIMGQQQKQEQIIRAQDDNLELLGHTVGNLKEIGRTIGDTLESQSRLLEDIEAQTDKADSGIRGAVRKVNQLIDSTKDTTQWCIIFILILVLVGLAVLVYYI